jgi:type VII secretion integral membrane protein EccD
MAGENLADTGLAHSGWVLQRLNEAPLDPSQTMTALGVHDGDLLYFRPRLAPIPEMMFDDVADVIATGIRERSDRWGGAHTRVFGFWAAGVLLLVGLVALMASGPSWAVPGATADVIAVLLLVGGAVLSRAVGDSGAGAVLGYCALPYAFFGGLVAPTRHGSLLSFGAVNLMAGFSVVVLVSLVAGFTVVEGLPNFLGTTLAALVGAIAALSVQLLHARPAGAAALAASLSLALSALIPSLAFRLARLPLPPVPASAADLRSEAQVFNGATVLQRTRDADRFTTGLVSTVAIVAIVAQAFVVDVRGWVALVMSLALSVVLLLRARVFGGRPQRLWLLCAGVTGVVLVAVREFLTQGQNVVVGAVVVPLMLAGLLALGMAVRLPIRWPTPFWGRAGDIVDLFFVVSLVPLALGLLNVYGYVRGLTG